MTYQETLDWLFKQLPVFQRIGKAAYKPNLNNTYDLMDILDQPHLKFKSVHIAGTNGKGSTAHMLASIYQQAGYKTGLYTSPHLRDFRERIRINGQMIPEQNVIDFIEKHQTEFSRIKPSFFEMTVGMAFAYFADEQVDIAIIETGLGGRLDSTNIIQPELSIITNIGKDHMQYLGNTLAEIATEKAGIIKEGIPVIIGEHQVKTDGVFINRSQAIKTSISFVQDNYLAKWKGEELQVFHDGKPYLSLSNFPLKGHYQLHNICTAVYAANLLGIPVNAIKSGLAKVVSNTSFLGRWQTINKKPLTICDTAHNEEGLKEVMKQLLDMEYENLHFVLGVVDDKQLDKILQLFPKEATYYYCKADIPRGLDANILAKKAAKLGFNGHVYDSVQKALMEAQKASSIEDLVFVGGSTFTVAEVV